MQFKKFITGHQSLLWGISAVILWGLIASISRTLLELLGKFTAGGCIYITGGLVCFVLYPPHKREFSWKYHIGGGALVAAYLIFFSIGLGLATNRVQAVEMSLINYLWPFLTLLFSIFFFQKKVCWSLLTFATILSFLGLACSSSILSGVALTPRGLWNNFCSNPAAYLCMLIAAVCWGLYSNLLGTVDKKIKTDALPYFMIFAGIILFLLRYPFHEVSTWNCSAFLQIAVMAIFPTGIGYFCWDRAMVADKPTSAITFSYLTPLVSAIFCSIILQVALPWTFYGACLMVIAGAMLSRAAIQSKEGVGSGK